MSLLPVSLAVAVLCVGCSDGEAPAVGSGGLGSGGLQTPETGRLPTTGENVPSRARWTPEDIPLWSEEATGLDLLDWVTGLARAAAAEPWRPPVSSLAAGEGASGLPGLSYDEYRRIRWREGEAIWGGDFQVHLFHPGGAFDTPVRIYLVDGGRSEAVPFDPDRFEYDLPGGAPEAVAAEGPGDPGWAGFKLLFPLNDAEKMDEVVAFLGASYFRLLGAGQVYGLSARGVAVNTAGPDGEEFPDFVAFWLERPRPGARSVTVVGLLDGPSVAGAYRFDLTPGDPTTMEVEARLFSRERVGKLGVAPLTSMYLHGNFRPGGHDDVRPRVHDSEGLLMATGQGEWIWRPLSNRPSLSVTSLRDRDPAGFGLFQRERDFDRYLDLEALYHRRPSLWVEPLDGDWGQGGVELVEIPTVSEFNDNIVAYWAPDGGMDAGAERRFRYRLTTMDAVHPGEPVGRVVRTAIGWDALPGQADPPPRSRRRVIVDFSGPVLDGLTPDALEPVLSLSSGAWDDLRLQPLPGGGARVTFALVPEGDRPVDMRLFLARREGEGVGSNDEVEGFWNSSTSEAAGRVLTETWSYLWDPADAP